MEFINDILDNREIAILIWLGVFFIKAIFQKNIRKSLMAIWNVLTQKIILVSIILMLVYIGAMIYLFYQINFWDISNLSDTIFWSVGVAFVMFINIDRTKEDGYFQKVVLDNVKVVVFIEFVTNLYVFNFWAEIILVPVLVGIGGMLGIASTNPKYKQVESLLTKILIIFGVGYSIFALYNVIIDFKGFVSIDNLREFLLPPIFTIVFLPFIYLMAVYTAYDSIFRRIKHLIRNSNMARYAKWKTIFVFCLDLRALNKWLRKMVLLKFNRKEDIKCAIMDIKMNG
ncbi:MAG: hypothetical protein K8R40_10420 [Anaerolineaceae bacterium]|nr:hypothetical protein [Anaerolineaceae bacterium]